MVIFFRKYCKISRDKFKLHNRLNGGNEKRKKEYIREKKNPVIGKPRESDWLY